MKRAYRHPISGLTSFLHYWTRLAQGLINEGLEITHSRLMAELVKAGFAPSTISKWLHHTPLNTLSPLPEVSDSLQKLLESTVSLHRDRKRTSVPTAADATLNVAPPRIGSCPGDASAQAFWVAMVEARCIASAHRGIPYPSWLAALAPGAHPFRLLMTTVASHADFMSGRHLQYWLDVGPNRLELIVRFRNTMIGRSLRRDLSIPVQGGFVGRLLVEDFDREGEQIRVPIHGTDTAVAVPIFSAGL
jgi:hypothetical protein